MNSLPDTLLQHCRRIFIRGLTRQVRIGIHDFELQAPQRIIFDIDLYVPLAQSTPLNDLIEEVVDYDFVRAVVSQAIDRGHTGLQETLCDAVMQAILAHPNVMAARVSTRKPDVYEDCEAVGVESFQCKANPPGMGATL